RLSGRTGNRPVLSFVLRADRTSVEASERDDPRRAGHRIRGPRPRGLRAEADSDLLEQIDDHRVDRGRGLDAGALGPPARRRGRVEQSLRQHAPKRVLDADEQDRGHVRAAQSAADQIAWLSWRPITRRPTLYNVGHVGAAVAAIEASGLTKRYGTVDATEGIQLTVERGEFFGL